MSAPSLKIEIVNFLKINPNIDRLNFSIMAYKVNPCAYKKDVADAISSGKITLGTVVSSGAGSTYHEECDVLELSPSFSIAHWADQAYLVHECTHAYIDILNLGNLSGHQVEAVAYLAEAVFLEASKNPPLSGHEIRVVSHRIAKSILSGTYSVSAKDATDLFMKVAAEPLYRSTVLFLSKGFKRSLFASILRNL